VAQRELHPFSSPSLLATPLAGTGETCLDQFRALVTQIGNTLGYVRMVRTAGMRQSATAVQFIPAAKDDAPGGYETHSREGTATGTGVRAGAEAEAKEEDEDAAAGAEPAAAAAAAGIDQPLSEETVAAAKCLDDVIQNLMDSFGDETNYLQLLVEVRRRRETAVTARPCAGSGRRLAVATRCRSPISPWHRTPRPRHPFPTSPPPPLHSSSGIP